MIDISFPVAFAAGVISFFAPCVIPLLPAYVGYVTGVSVSELKKRGYTQEFVKKLIFSSLFYIIGFSMLFVLMGTTVAGLGLFFRRYSLWVQRLGGLLIILFGLDFGGFVHIPFLAKERKFSLPGWAGKLGYGRAFLIGIIFATAWTPCVGVVLGSILALAVGSGTAVHGAMLLFVYSLGISLPFLIVSLTLASAPKYIKVISSHVSAIAKVSGILLAFLGFLLLTDTYRFINGWLLQLTMKMGY